jgi:hypothetical protein
MTEFARYMIPGERHDQDARHRRHRARQWKQKASRLGGGKIGRSTDCRTPTLFGYGRTYRYGPRSSHHL